MNPLVRGLCKHKCVLVLASESRRCSTTDSQTLSLVHHRSLTTTPSWSFSRNSSSKRKRQPRRSIKPLSGETSSSSTTTATRLSPTTRDLIRRIVERNERRKRPSDELSPNQLANVATERILWLRNSVYKFWNPDYQPPEQNMSSQTENYHNASKRPQRKPFRLVMNGRWWFWNIAFALLPAFLIFVYMEFRVKPVMIAFYADQEERAKNGEESPQKLHQGALVQDGSLDHPMHVTTLGGRLSAFWNKVRMFIQGKLDHGSQPEEPQEASNTAGGTVQRRQILKIDKPKAATPFRGDGDDEIATTPLTLETLAQRLEQLERVVTTQSSPSTRHTSSHPHQSGIRTRRMEQQRRQSEAEVAASGHTDERALDWIGKTWKTVSGQIGKVFEEIGCGADEGVSVDTARGVPQTNQSASHTTSSNNSSATSRTATNSNPHKSEQSSLPRQNKVRRKSLENNQHLSKLPSSTRGESGMGSGSPIDPPWWKLW